MNFQLKQLDLFNFMSFESLSYEFSADGFVLVEGKNQYSLDNSASNGSGKSSLWEAISWGLTGETIRGTRQVVREGTNEGCFVRLKFFLDNHAFEILRSKSHKEYKTNLIIKIDNEDVSGKGIRESEKILFDRIPFLTPNFLGCTMLLGQGMPNRFSNNAPSARKDFLENLLCVNEELNSLKEKILLRKQEISNQLRQSQDAELQASTEQSIIRDQLTQLVQDLESICNVETLATRKQKLSNEISSGSSKLLQLQQEYQEKGNDRDKKNQLSTELQERKDRLLQEKINYIQNSVEPVNRELISCKHEISDVASKIEQLKNTSDICPTCGQKIPNFQKIDYSDKENLLRELENQEKQLEEKKASLDKELSSRFDEEYERIETQQSLISKQLQPLSFRLIELMDSTRSLEIEKNQNERELIEIEAKLQSIQQNKLNLDSKISLCKNQLEDLQKIILYYKKEQEEYEQRAALIVKISSFLTKDFRAHLLQSSIQNLNQICKTFSSFVFEGDGAVSVQLDDKNINLFLNGKEYEQLSGGEQKKVDILIQLAIRELLCSESGFQCNFICLDELFDALDATSCTKIIDLITNQLVSIQSVYVVTHRKDLDIPYDKKLLFLKNSNGVSSIQ